MANDSGLRASEIKGVLLAEIENYGEALQAEEIGEVLEVKDGIARIYGLTKAMASEMLEITAASTGETVTALALNLEEDNIGAVIMGDWTALHEGDQVRRTGRHGQHHRRRPAAVGGAVADGNRRAAAENARGTRGFAKTA